MPSPKTPAQQVIKQTAEEVLNDEAYHLYIKLIDKITQFQLGRGEGPTDDDVAMWRAVQAKRIATSAGPLDTFFYRPDRQ
ncbi:hypothetical protein SAMN05216350_106201 [Polaromonas sp. YR568]|uniref:hypothetical protein n=1 Tax=Polaromonas sp. YR568 TaxID=1855301 RepID=UPI0008E19C25|nr:hypothetical protein [Polaromonas sp. YR568]SFU85336.1 hypothetical protein SAMN05216350_106201 [Polaromonas sp. YR568]